MIWLNCEVGIQSNLLKHKIKAYTASCNIEDKLGKQSRISGNNKVHNNYRITQCLDIDEHYSITEERKLLPTSFSMSLQH